MLCSNCQTQHIPGSNYCHSCGVAIPAPKVTGVCPACGITLAVNAESCSNCGAQVAQVNQPQIHAHTIRYFNADQIEQLYKDADNS